MYRRSTCSPNYIISPSVWPSNPLTMNSFSAGSKCSPQNDTERLHPHYRHRHFEPSDRPGKRRRSISPLDENLSRNRTTQIPHHLQTTLTKAKKEELASHYPPKPSPTISAALDSMNERATRLGLENAYPEDIEMDFCPHSDGEDAEEEATNYERVPLQQSTPTFASSILPLHKPHPIAYQQHLALISSSRSRKLLNSNRHSSPQKQSPLDHGQHASKKENNFWSFFWSPVMFILTLLIFFTS